MSSVLDARPIKKHGYRFRSGLFGKQILQIGHVIQDWDTNTGIDDGPEYTSWRDADRYEADKFMNSKDKGQK